MKKVKKIPIATTVPEPVRDRCAEMPGGTPPPLLCSPRALLSTINRPTFQQRPPSAQVGRDLDVLDLLTDGLGSIGRTNDRVAIWAIGISLVATSLRNRSIVFVRRVSISGEYTAVRPISLMAIR